MKDSVFDLAFGDGNPRNSEGAFLRTASGRIRFIYSRFVGDKWFDGAAADLAEFDSDDGGESWQYRGIVIPRGDAENIIDRKSTRLNSSHGY